MQPHYRERLTPGPVVWLVAIGFAACVGVAYGSALGTVAGVLVGAGLTSAVLLIIWFSSPTLSVSTSVLEAGGARIDLHAIGRVTALDSDAMRLARNGQHLDADARSFTVIRPWSGPVGVLVHITDHEDPHPAWVLTSRHPGRLITALGG